ncbi:hypothetical protein BJ912DRAFT_1063435 [Pholiota molesta]|nr:hypothetical protein BJ912DRAFT_1063435 [Pholiota molesta]
MRFLDVEAAPGDSSEDESTEESESHEENGNNTVYRRDITINERDLVNTETTNEQVYERHLHALSEPRIIEETDWEALLERAKGRGKKANPSTGDDTWYSDEVILRVRATEFLWEIQCTPGKEETFCDKIRKQSTDSSSTSSRPNYIYGHKDLPGRIYVEMNTHLEAVNFAQSYADLYSSGMKRVPSDTMLQRVSLRDRTYSPQTWATICRDSGKWKIYEGDTALIALRGSHLVAIIIPRIAIHSTEKKATRPHPKPCKWSDICSHSGNATEVGHQEHYTYMGYYFSPDGFIITDISDIQLTPPHERPIPTSEVLQAFRASAFLAQSTYQQTEREIAQRQIRIHDRVQVISGIYQGLTGTVTNITNDEASVFIESQDDTSLLPINEIRMHLLIGDEVEVHSGEYMGNTGWVVKTSDEDVTIVNTRNETEITVLRSQTRFYSSPSTLTLRSRNTNAGWVGGQDENRIYIGKEAMVVGPSEYKGKQGIIKVIRVDNTAEIELNNQNRQRVSVHLTQLLLWNDFSRRTQRMLNMYPISTSYPISHGIPSQNICRTPMPASPTLASSPAWDPSSRTPEPLAGPSTEREIIYQWDPSSLRPGPPTWLEDSSFSELRFLLVEQEHPNNILEFRGVEGNMIVVRDKMKTRTVSLESISWLRPDNLNDMVVPIVGDLRGRQFKVKLIEGDLCTLHTVGKRLRKWEHDPVLSRNDLARVYPGKRA